MAVPHAPIIVLRKRDDAVFAFFTKSEALTYLGWTREFDADDLADSDFFDARGRRLIVSVGPDRAIQDVHVESDEDHSEQVRGRVGHRSQHAREVLERQRDTFERVDESPLTMANEDVAFEIFAWRLASVLRPDGSPSDPVLKSGQIPPVHNAGWWHNTFGH